MSQKIRSGFVVLHVRVYNNIYYTFKRFASKKDQHSFIVILLDSEQPKLNGPGIN